MKMRGSYSNDGSRRGGRLLGVKTLLVGLSLSCASVLATLAILECLVRWNIIPNPVAKYYTAEGSRVPGSTRVLILGDSFLGKEHAGWRLHRNLLSRLSGRHIQILNAAYQGSGPFEYLDDLRSVGVPYRPDVVLLGYSVGNDLTDVMENKHNQTDMGSVIRNLLRPYLKRSYTYRLVVGRLVNLCTGWAQGREIGGEAVPRGWADVWGEIAAKYPDLVLDNTMVESAKSQAAWKNVEALLEAIYRTCEEMHARLMMVMFPDTTQVNPSHFEFFENVGVHVDHRSLESSGAQDRLNRFCAARNLACLDLLPAFRRSQEELYQLPPDGHLNERGNVLAAEAIADFLLDHLADK
jgi:hypothetical protein